MMETMRARNGSAQSNFGYSAPFDGIQFSDPWARANPTTSGQMLASTLAQDNSGIPSMARPMRQDSMYQGSFNTGSYGTQGAGSPQQNAYAMGGYSQSFDPSANRNLYNLQSPVHNTDRRLSQPSPYPQTSAAPPPSSYPNMDSPAEMRHRQGSIVEYPRTQSNSGSFTATGRDHYDALDSARGMVAMSQAPRHSMSGLTSAPRTASTASTGSYYPASTSSSISSASSYPYFGSMDSSSTELSSTDGMFDSARPSLPRPAGMISSNMLPHQSGQATMMSTFSSRVSSSTQKKHKCKICDKRFTRPSSLQTHMYSHTGEKPFACDVDGCGRQFSVVSNLRRHRKVHKGLSENQDNGCGVTA